MNLLYALMASAAMLALHFVVGLPWRWAALAAFVGWPVIGVAAIDLRSNSSSVVGFSIAGLILSGGAALLAQKRG